MTPLKTSNPHFKHMSPPGGRLTGLQCLATTSMLFVPGVLPLSSPGSPSASPTLCGCLLGSSVPPNPLNLSCPEVVRLVLSLRSQGLQLLGRLPALCRNTSSHWNAWQPFSFTSLRIPVLHQALPNAKLNPLSTHLAPHTQCVPDNCVVWNHLLSPHLWHHPSPNQHPFQTASFLPLCLHFPKAPRMCKLSKKKKKREREKIMRSSRDLSLESNRGVLAPTLDTEVKDTDF